MSISKSEGFMDPIESEDVEETTGTGTKVVEGIRHVAKRGYEMAGKVLDMNSHADWAEGKFAEFKNVSREWVSDAYNTLKMKTIDKWRFMREKKATNKLIAHKQQDIINLDSQAENEQRNIQSFENGKAGDIEKFNTALQSIKDPQIYEIFERNRDEKVSGWEASIDTSRNFINGIEDQKIQYASEIVNFRKDIEEAGEGFNKKIDSKINHIREKCGYDNKQEQLKSLVEQFEVGQEMLNATNDKIAQYKNALEMAHSVGVKPEDINALEDGILELESEKQKIELQIEQNIESGKKVKKAIAKIDKKTAKWEKMRKKMGLDKGEKDTDTADIVSSENVENEDPSAKDNLDDTGNSNDGREVVDNDSSTEQSDEEEEIDSDNEGETNSENAEHAESVEDKSNKEAIAEWLGKFFEKLYKNVNNKDKTTVEILDEVLLIGKWVDYYRYAFKEEEYAALSKGVIQIKNMYDHAEIEMTGDSVAEQIKKDVFNKVLRKLPDWINI